VTPAILIQLAVNGIAIGAIYALPALGISLIWNAAGLFNFAQADLLTLGAYVMYALVVSAKIPYIWAFIITTIVMGLLGYLLSRIYFYPMIENRVNPHIVLIGTVALSVFIQNLLLVIWGTTPKSVVNPFGYMPFRVGDIFVMPHVVWIVAIVSVLLLLLQFFLRRTLIGTGMRAVAQQQIASWLMGIRNDRMIALTFLLSTAIAATGGVLISAVFPLTPRMGSMIAVKAMAAVLIGGLGSFSGALVGGLAVGISETIFATLVNPAYRDVFIFAVLITFLIFKPGGIFKAEISEKV